MKSARGLLLLFALVSIAIVDAASAHVSVALPNADMENGFSDGIAVSWSPIWVSNGISGEPVFFSSSNVKHRGSYAQGIDFANLGSSSDILLKSYAGIFQRIPAHSGNVYTANAWIYCEMPASITNVCGFAIGIDPNGGTDSNSDSVIWSTVMWNGSSSGNANNWKQILISGKAASDFITVFIRATLLPGRFATLRPNKVYIDQLYILESNPLPSQGALLNPNFENGFYSPDPGLPDAYPNNWVPFGSVYGSKSGNGVSICSAAADTPEQGLKVFNIWHGSGKTGDNGWGIFQTVATEPGSQYELYTLAKGSGYNQGRAIGIDPTGSTTVPSPQTVWIGDSADDNTWRRLYIPPVSVTSNALTVFLRVNHQAIEGSWDARFDNIELLKYGGETIPPAQITTLAASDITPTSVKLTWISTGDDGNLGKAASLVVKYSTSPLTEANFNSAPSVPNVPAPEYRGTQQSVNVSGLVKNTDYYFAVKAFDESGNASAISNVVLARTLDDTVPPSRITSLFVSRRLSDAILLGWNAPSHVNYAGVTEPAAAYELRYSTSPITEANWASATVAAVQVAPIPAAPGSYQTMWVRKLNPATRYYFGLKSCDLAANWSDLSNVPSTTTSSAGSAPYWAWHAKELMRGWYNKVLSDCTSADANSGSTANKPNDPFSWYHGSLDKDCEAQPTITAMLNIVRDPWMLDYCRRLSDHVWNLTYANTNIDANIYRSTGQKVPIWNESHHLGELSWNGVGLVAVDYDNPKWLSRAVEYCRHLTHWTGYTGNSSNGGPHLHFKSMFFKGDEWDYSGERPYTLVDTPEDRRLTRAAFYAAWRDPNSRMSTNQLISDFLYQLDTATAEDAMRTDLNKPLGVLPAEIRFDNHQIGGYSGNWYRMKASLGGAIGSSSEWWWDWGVGWVQARDAYYELIDQYLITGEEKFIVPLRETIRHFSVDSAINNIPPQYMFINNDQYYKGPIFPWPDYNDPWGGFQYLVNYMYRQYTGDQQFDQAWLGHAQVLWNVMPKPGERRCGRMIRSTLTWTGDAMESDTYKPYKASNVFYLAWKITGDKEWLCRALDEMSPDNFWSGQWIDTMYTGIPTVGINRLPDQPITWNNTNKYTNWACLVLDWDYTHIKWLTYNFDSTNRTIPIWLWSLKPGNYILRHGNDSNMDDQMDVVVETIPFTISNRRTELSITLPANRMEVWEIVPAEISIRNAKQSPDGAVVTIAEGIVTKALDGCFYIETPDRLFGIRIESLAKVNPGDSVKVYGQMATISGERCVKCVSPTVVSIGNAIPQPFVMTNRDIGGAASGMQAGVRNPRGPNNIGLLVRTSGVVKNHGTDYIFIDDGSKCDAGKGVKGLKVMTSQRPPIGSSVIVTGASSCEIPPGETTAVRVIRAGDDVAQQ